MFDNKGAIVRSKSLVFLPGHNQIEIELEGLAKGAYLIQVMNEAGTFQKNTLILKR